MGTRSLQLGRVAGTVRGTAAARGSARAALVVSRLAGATTRHTFPSVSILHRIGRRVFKSTDGSQKATDTYWATFSVAGKQRFISLEVFKRADAIREAHRLSQRLETQTQLLCLYPLDWQTIMML